MMQAKRLSLQGWTKPKWSPTKDGDSPRNIMCSISTKILTSQQNMRGRVIEDKWSSKILWLCAIGTVACLYMTVAQRQMQNRNRNLDDALKAMDSKPGSD